MTTRHVSHEVRQRWQRWLDAAMSGLAAGDGPDLSDLAAHLRSCPRCRQEAAAWARLHAVTPTGAGDTPPPADLLPAVLAALPAASPAQLARQGWADPALTAWTPGAELGLWHPRRLQGLGWALLAAAGLTATATLATVLLAPALLAQALAAMATLGVTAATGLIRLYTLVQKALAAYHLLLLLHPLPAALAAVALVTGTLVFARMYARRQTFDPLPRIEG